MQYLKQSTAVTIKLGPFLDETSGKDAEIALTIAQADIRLSKNGGAFAQTGNAAGATHDENGWYGIPLNTTDTGTLGRLKVAAHESGALPCFAEFMIVTANVYDSLCSTDKIEVDLLQMGGVVQSATDLKDFADEGYDPATNKIEACKVNDDMRGTDSANTVVPDAAGVAATPAEVATALTDIHLDHLLATDYDPASKPGVVTALLNELVEDDSGVSRFTENSLEQAPSGTGASAAVIADAVWDEAIADHVGAGSFGAKNQNAVPSESVADYRATGFNTVVPDPAGTAATPAEVAIALADIHLDHLLAADYDPSNKPGVGTALLNELVENDAGISRFTENALEQAPSGTGASAAVIADAVWDEAIADHTAGISFGGKNQNVVPSETLNDYMATGFSTHTPEDVRIETDNNSTKLGSIEGDVQNLQSRTPAALVSGRMNSDAVAISGSTDAADKLEASAETIVVGSAVTGTLSITQMTTDLTEATDDHFMGRIIIWTSGVLKDQASNCTDYDGTTKMLTYTAVTEAPSNADTFCIV